MLLIRRGVFETNSSNTHSLTITDKDTYEKFRNGELYLDWYSETLTDTKDHNSCYTFDEIAEKYSHLDFYSETHITPKGEKIIAFGYYGHD